MENIIQLQKKSALATLMGDPIVFDDIMVDGGGICYDTVAGVITIPKPGTYFVSWWVNAININASSCANFALLTTDDSIFQSNSIIKNGVTSGFAIITQPATFALINHSTGNVLYSDFIDVKAMLSVFQLDAASATTDGYCYAVRQFENLLTQMVNMYPDTLGQIYVDRLPSYAANLHSMYKAPGADSPGFLIMESEGQYLISPLTHINTIFFPNITFREDIVFLPPPDPLPSD